MIGTFRLKSEAMLDKISGENPCGGRGPVGEPSFFWSREEKLRQSGRTDPVIGVQMASPQREKSMSSSRYRVPRPSACGRATPAPYFKHEWVFRQLPEKAQGWILALWRSTDRGGTVHHGSPLGSANRLTGSSRASAASCSPPGPARHLS